MPSMTENTSRTAQLLALMTKGDEAFNDRDFEVLDAVHHADMVAFIFREEVYRPDKESLKGIAELILAKQRNSPTGRVKLAFLNRYTKFENLAADTGNDDAPFE